MCGALSTVAEWLHVGETRKGGGGPFAELEIQVLGNYRYLPLHFVYRCMCGSWGGGGMGLVLDTVGKQT